MMARPILYLSIPLGQIHPDFHARITDLHVALNLATPDSTLLASPQRVHLILGVMNLTHESLPTGLDIFHRLPTLLPLTDVPPTINISPLTRSMSSRGNPAVVPTSYGLAHLSLNPCSAK